MRTLRLFTSIPAIVLGVLLCVGITPAFAVDGVQPNASLPDLFELDGNPYQDNGTPYDADWYTPHDWDTLYLWCDKVTGVCPEIAGQSVPYEFTTILSDPAPMTIFTTGGSKDTHDILDWKYKDGSVPDKDDITNAYAAAYVNEADICYASNGDVITCGSSDIPLHEAGDLIIYFGLDRYDNSGDAFAGFWFLQNKVERLDGQFTPGHVAKREVWDDDLQDYVILPGDLLILVEYPQGSGAEPLIKAYMWDPDLLPPENLDEDGKSIGPLEMIYSSANGSATARCDGYGGKLACAITNATDLATPPEWTYLSKDGTDWFPYETFFEGGINLTQLLGGQNICVHTFLAETRSSNSETAQLKDFVDGRFDLCGSEIITVIYDGDDNPVGFPASENPAAVMAGTQIYDEATVTFTGPGLEMDPEGTVDFYLYEGDACSGEPIESTPVQVPLVPGTLGDNIATAKTGLYSLAAAQCYSFHAEFTSTNPEFPGAVLEDAACEWVCIAKYPSEITTKIHKGSDHSTNYDYFCNPSLETCGSPYVDLGTTIHDHAYVTGDSGGPAFGIGPPGTVEFHLWKNGTCADDEFTGTFGGQSWPVTVPIQSNGQAETPDFTPMQGEDIAFSFKAKFNGDDNYLASNLSSCEQITGQKLPANVVTMVFVRDRAKVTDNQGNPIDDGAVTFQAYDSGNCTGTALGAAVEVNLDAQGVADEPHSVEIMLENDPHVISYRAVYDGGSGLYEQTQANCEKVEFSYPQ